MKIGAILVLYNPDVARTRNVVELLLPQVDAICAIDNSDNGTAEAMFEGKANVEYISLGGNYGIAKAQNVGIRHFKEAGFDFILFIDQDTMPEKNTVSRLLTSWQCLDKEGIKVGAVAPIGINHFTNKTISYSIAQIRNLEWCWRAADKVGARFFYDYDIQMNHILGIGSKTVGKRSIHITPPYRMYYQYRNFIWLLRKKYVPRRWLRKNGVKYVLKIGYYVIGGPDRLAYIKNIARGIRDGIKGVRS